MDERNVIQRIQQHDIGKTRKRFAHDLAHVRIAMNRVHDHDLVPVLQRELLQAGADRLEWVAEALPPVRRNEDDLARIASNFLQRLVGKRVVSVRDIEQCVDDRVARQGDPRSVDTFAQEVVASACAVCVKYRSAIVSMIRRFTSSGYGCALS